MRCELVSSEASAPIPPQSEPKSCASQRQEALQLVLPWFAALARDGRAAAKLQLSAESKAAVLAALTASLAALAPADGAQTQVSWGMVCIIQTAIFFDPSSSVGPPEQSGQPVQ